jgi:hypothetical protein
MVVKSTAWLHVPCRTAQDTAKSSSWRLTSTDGVVCQSHSQFVTLSHALQDGHGEYQVHQAHGCLQRTMLTGAACVLQNSPGHQQDHQAAGEGGVCAEGWGHQPV